MYPGIGPTDAVVPSEYWNTKLLPTNDTPIINLPGDTAFAISDTKACFVMPFCTTAVTSEPVRAVATGNCVIG